MPTPRRKSYRCSCLSLPNTPTAFLLISKESASELPFSRPARQSLTFWLACSLSRLGRLFFLECFKPCCCLQDPLSCYQPERQLLGRIRTCQRKVPFHGALDTWGNWIANKIKTIGVLCKVMEVKTHHRFSCLLFRVKISYNRNGRLRIHSAIAPPWSFTAIHCRIWNFRNYAAADMSIDSPKVSATPNA